MKQSWLQMRQQTQCYRRWPAGAHAPVPGEPMHRLRGRLLPLCLPGVVEGGQQVLQHVRLRAELAGRAVDGVVGGQPQRRLVLLQGWRWRVCRSHVCGSLLWQAQGAPAPSKCSVRGSFLKHSGAPSSSGDPDSDHHAAWLYAHAVPHATPRGPQERMHVQRQPHEPEHMSGRGTCHAPHAPAP